MLMMKQMCLGLLSLFAPNQQNEVTEITPTMAAIMQHRREIEEYNREIQRMQKQDAEEFLWASGRNLERENHPLTEAQAAWNNLVIQKKYDKAIETMESVPLDELRFKGLVRTVLRSSDPALIITYLTHTNRCGLWDFMMAEALFTSLRIQWEVIPDHAPVIKNDRTICESLLYAAAHGDLEHVRYCLKELKKNNALHLINDNSFVQMYRTKQWPKEHQQKTREERFYRLPVAAAAENNHVEIFRLLVKYGADLSKQNDEYLPARTYKSAFVSDTIERRIACENMSKFLREHALIEVRILRWFDQLDSPLKRKSGLINIVRAVYHCPETISEYFTRYKNTCFGLNKQGETVLHYAVLKSNPLLIRLFLETTPELIETRNKNGLTPLHLAYSKNLHVSLKAILDCCELSKQVVIA